jgi:hypothetical protein
MCRSAAAEARGKSMIRTPLLPIAAMVLALAGCKQEPAPAPQPSESAVAAEMEAPPPPVGQDRKVKEANARYEFEFNYPAAADAIPALKGKLDADLADQRAKLVAESREAADEAKKEGYPYHPHSFSVDWKVVTDLPGWLSLSTIVATYEGGAHPNYVFDALLWDKAAGGQIAAVDLFTSKAALSKAIGPAFCDAIDSQRAEKRGERIERESGDMFTNCLDPLDYTLILGSAGKVGFDRIGVLVPPYEAGPYAEGSYEVTLPVTARIIALVKPEYRKFFVAGR